MYVVCYFFCPLCQCNFFICPLVKLVFKNFSIQFQGPEFFNSLSCEIQNSESVGLFGKDLKSSLFLSHIYIVLFVELHTFSFLFFNLLIDHFSSSTLNAHGVLSYNYCQEAHSSSVPGFYTVQLYIHVAFLADLLNRLVSILFHILKFIVFL